MQDAEEEGEEEAEAMSRRGRRMYLCEHPTELYSFAEDIDVEGIAERPALLNLSLIHI